MTGIQPTVSVEWSPTTDPLATPVWEAVAGWRSIRTDRGRQNEVDQIQAGTASIVLDNRDRRFDPTLPAGTQYIDLPGVAGEYASTPDSPAVSLQGTATGLRLSGHANCEARHNTTTSQTVDADMEVRWEGILDEFQMNGAGAQGYLISNYGHLVSGWKIYLTTGTNISFGASISGTSAAFSVAHALAPGTRVRIRLTRVHSTGSTQFYTGPATTDWASLPATGAPSVVFAGTTIPSGTALTRVGGGEGSRSPRGVAFSASVTIGGNVVLAPDFTGPPWSVGAQAGAAQVDSAGKSWSLFGNAEIVAAAERRSLRVSGTGAYASAPDSAALSITGDIDIRAKVALDNWVSGAIQGIVGKYEVNLNQRGYMMRVAATGELEFVFSSDGTNFFTGNRPLTGVTNGAPKWLRVTRAQASGDTNFYVSDNGVTWTALGTTAVLSAGTAIFDSTAPATVGAQGTTNLATGNFFYAEVRSGINGTIVANPNFEARPWDAGESSGTTGADVLGNTWTLTGSGAMIQRAFASDLDIRVKVALDDWTPAADMAFVAKQDTGASSYRLKINPGGTLTLFWSPNNSSVISVTSDAIPGFADGTAGWVRATLDIDNGSGLSAGTFYKSNDGLTWVQLGTVRTTAARGWIVDSTFPLYVGQTSTGSQMLAGNLYFAEVRNGINGTVVARFDTNAFPQTGTRTPSSWVSSTGEGWTVNGTGWAWGGAWGSPYAPNVVPMKRFRVRATYNSVAYDIFQGFVESWDQSYVNPNDATVEVRLTDFFEVLNSAVFSPSPWEVVVREDNPRTWFRLGDLAGATTVTDVIAGAQGSVLGGALGATGLVAEDPDTAFSTTQALDQGIVVTDPNAGLGQAPNHTFEFLVHFRSLDPATSVTVMLAESSVDGSPDAYIQTAYSGGVHRLGGFGGVPITTNTTYHVLFTTATTLFGGDVLYVSHVLPDGTVDTEAISYGVGGTMNRNGRLFIGGGGHPYSSVPLLSPDAVVDDFVVYDHHLAGFEWPDGRIEAHAEAALAPWVGDTTGERVGRVLDYLDVAAADRSIDTTSTTLRAAGLGQSLLAHLQDVNEVEQGLLFITKDGKVRFRGRHSGFNLASQATFGDGAGELPYQDIAFEYSKQLIYNVVRRQTRDGQLMEASDSASISRYGRRVDVKTGLAADSDLTALDLANYRLSKSKDPVVRVAEVALAPERDPAALYPQALGREIGEQVTVRRRPQGIGAPIDFDARIEGVSHTITPSAWATQFRLSPADTGLYLRLDLTSGPGLGELKLAY